MSDHPIEMEAKFSCPTNAVGDVMRIHRLGSLLRVEDRQERHTDTYIDTHDHKLRQQDAALRVREDQSGVAVATFKGPRLDDASSVTRRVEMESQLEAGLSHFDNSQPIGLFEEIPAFRQAKDMLGDVMLEEIARIVTNRRTMLFRATTGDLLELSIDRVAGEDLRNRRQQQFLEVELEAAQIQDDAVFEQATADLRQQAPALKSTTASKLDRVLEDEA